MKPTIEVETVYDWGGYHNWTLVLPTTKKHPAQRFWLGQDVKFCNRVLSLSPSTVQASINIRLGKSTDEPINLADDKVNTMLADFIIDQLGGLEYVLEQEPWAFAAQ